MKNKLKKIEKIIKILILFKFASEMCLKTEIKGKLSAIDCRHVIKAYFAFLNAHFDPNRM